MYLITISDKDKTSFHSKVEHTVCNPPETWHKHMEDPMYIIKMEYNELVKAYEEKDQAGYRENLVHLAAACTLAEKYK